MKVNTAPRPWYFKDGSPINPDVIRRLVLAAVPPAGTEEAEQWVVPYQLIVDTVKYFTKQIEEDLIRLLVAQFNGLYRRRFSLTGDSSLDAKRLWRRSYMRRYRLKMRADIDS